jgi:geranylgeranyl reductase family protein
MSERWDLLVVGAGPAGAAAAIGALWMQPELRVLLLDRADFPRDKSCGDGIAPHAIDLLTAHGVTGLVDECVPVGRLTLSLGDASASRLMQRPAWVIPRELFDARLVAAAERAGAVRRVHRVRNVGAGPTEGTVLVDDDLTASVVVGADGAGSLVARSLGAPAGSSALAIRGYAPTPARRRGEQVIVFGQTRQPSYAWSFDRGDGLANVGYGELLTAARPRPSRALLLAQLERLLPGAAEGAQRWRGHHLPLSTWGWRPGDGPVLLAGDAAGLVNPMTGEGIYYAVLTGLLAGRAAAAAIRHGRATTAGRRYRRAVGPALRGHLAHSAAGARLMTTGPVLRAGLAAAAEEQRLFDDLVDLGLADGRLTGRLLAGIGRRIVPRRADMGGTGTFG